MPTDLSKHARTLVEQYRLEGNAFQLRVRAEFPADRNRAHGARSRRLSGTEPDRSRPATGRPLTRAAIEKATRCSCGARPRPRPASPNDKHLAFVRARPSGIVRHAVQPSSGLAEVVIPPRSALVGREVFPGMVTESGDL
jgi:hypothetical protein